MYQLDFEEFLIANDFGEDAIKHLRKSFEQKQSLPQEIHDKVLGFSKIPARGWYAGCSK